MRWGPLGLGCICVISCLISIKTTCNATNISSDPCLSAEYLNGKIEFEIPRIRLTDFEGNDWRKREYYIDEIDRGLYLRFYSVPGIDGKIFIGNTEVQRDVMGLFTLGTTLYSLMDPKTEILKLILTNQSEQTKTFDESLLVFFLGRYRIVERFL